MTLAPHPAFDSEYSDNIATNHNSDGAAPAESNDLGPLVTAVLDMLGLEGAGLRPVAAAMALSARTLERRLAAQGLSFHGLVDAYRRERALWLLQHTDLRMEQIATELGFCGAKNFSRTFRRWYGGTPSQLRRTAAPAGVLYQGTACSQPAESLQLSHR